MGFCSFEEETIRSRPSKLEVKLRKNSWEKMCMGKGETPRSDECLILGKDSVSSRKEYIILPLSLCLAPEPGQAAVGWGPPWFCWLQWVRFAQMHWIPRGNLQRIVSYNQSAIYLFIYFFR